jgi:hypothetical protein
MKISSKALLTVLALLIAWPGLAEAQRRKAHASDDRYYNRWSLEPYAGAFRDAYDLTGTRTGYLLGVRVGYLLGSRWRLHGNVGYNETQDVAYSPIPTGIQYNNEWVLTTAGAEFDVVPGRTAGSIGVNAGVGWRRVQLDDESTIPGPGLNLASNGFASYEVIVPSLTFRHRLTTRAALTARFEDYMFDVFDGTTDHSLAVTLGVSFR